MKIVEKLAQQIEQLFLVLYADADRLNRHGDRIDRFLEQLERVETSVKYDDLAFREKINALKDTERHLRSASFELSGLKSEYEKVIHHLESGHEGLLGIAVI